MELVVLVYGLTDSFPESERYGLTSQIRRCAISIPSNIAEGSKRGTKKDFRHFLLMSFGSGAELETQLEIAKRLSYIKNAKKYQGALLLLGEVMRMLSAMVNRSN